MSRGVRWPGADRCMYNATYGWWKKNVEKIGLTFLKRDREKNNSARTPWPSAYPTTNVSEFVPRKFTNLEYHDQRVRVGTP
jgi:hypothetical protein